MNCVIQSVISNQRKLFELLSEIKSLYSKTNDTINLIYKGDTVDSGTIVLLNKDMSVSEVKCNNIWKWAVKADSGQNINSGVNEGISVTVDDLNNIYVTGFFKEFIQFYNPDETIFSSLNGSTDRDLFIGKLNPNGEWQWIARAIDTENGSNDFANAITIDISGNIYLTGFFNSPGIEFYNSNNISSGITLSSSPSISGANIFVAKINSSGIWEWAIRALSNGNSQGKSITTDENGNIYITGFFRQTLTFYNKDDIDPVEDLTLTTSNTADVLVAQINPEGERISTAKAGNDSQNDSGRSISYDNSGNLYISGEYGNYIGDMQFFNSGNTPSSITLPATQNTDVFLAKINIEGEWQWAVRASGDSNQNQNRSQGTSVSVYDFDEIYIGGFFTENLHFFDNNSTNAKFSLSSSASQSGFVGRINGDGIWQWVSYTDTDEETRISSVISKIPCNISLTGVFKDNIHFYNSDKSQSTIFLSSTNDQNVFVAKLDRFGFWKWATKVEGATNRENPLTFDQEENIITTGGFLNEAKFFQQNRPSPEIELNTDTDTGAFVAKLIPEKKILGVLMKNATNNQSVPVSFLKGKIIQNVFQNLIPGECYYLDNCSSTITNNPSFPCSTFFGIALNNRSILSDVECPCKE